MHINMTQDMFNQTERFHALSHALKKNQQKLLANNDFMSSNIETYYKTTPQVKILNEKWEEKEYFRAQLWEIATDTLCFTPIALSFIKIHLTALKEIDPLALMPLEEAALKIGHSTQFITNQLIEGSEFKELASYLNSSYKGRIAQFIVDNRIVADVIEFACIRPNKIPDVSILDYIMPDKASKSLANRRIEDLLLHVKGALEATPTHVINNLLIDIPFKDRQKIGAQVNRIEHIAFIAPAGVNPDDLDALTTHAGFPDQHQLLPSVLLAKELGELVHKDSVPTRIYKAWGLNHKNQNIGVEIFLPEDQPTMISKWIKQGRGAHIALKVESKESIYLVMDILQQYHFHIPEFMHNQPMENKAEHALILYVDLKFQGHDFRLEFYYKDQN